MHRCSHLVRPDCVIISLALLCAGRSPLLAQETISIPAGDGAAIVADMYGVGPRAVILAHGGRFDRGSWRKQALVLVRAGFRVVAIDFRAARSNQVRFLSQAHRRGD